MVAQMAGKRSLLPATETELHWTTYRSYPLCYNGYESVVKSRFSRCFGHEKGLSILQNCKISTILLILRCLFRGHPSKQTYFWKKILTRLGMKDKIHKRNTAEGRLFLCYLTSKSHGQSDCRLTSSNISYKKRLVVVRIVEDSYKRGRKSWGNIVFSETRHFLSDALQHKEPIHWSAIYF